VFGKHSYWTFPLFVFNGTSYFVHISAAVFLLVYLGAVQEAYDCSSLELFVLASGVLLVILAHELVHQRVLWLIDETRFGGILRKVGIELLGVRQTSSQQSQFGKGSALAKDNESAKQAEDSYDHRTAFTAAPTESIADEQGDDLPNREQKAGSVGYKDPVRHRKSTVHSVTLFPFGGVSEVAGRSSAWAIISSAFAAPIASFLLAFLFGLAFDGTFFPTAMVDVISGGHSEFSLMLELARANWFLGVVNLIPLLPFDGGLLLLSMRRLGVGKRETGDELAQKFSTWSIVGCGVGIGIAWLSYSSILLAILFASALMVALRLGLLAQAYGAAGSLKASDAMIGIDRLTVLPHGTRLTSALRQSLKSFQSVFPIVKGAELLGMVERDDLLKATQRSEGYVAEFIRNDIVSVRPNVPLKEVVALFESVGLNYLPVIEDQQLRGLIVKDRLFEFLLVRGMEEMRKRMPSEDDWFDM
jgi:CBS domain-containing protein